MLEGVLHLHFSKPTGGLFGRRWGILSPITHMQGLAKPSAVSFDMIFDMTVRQAKANWLASSTLTRTKFTSQAAHDGRQRHDDFHGLPAHVQPALRCVAMVPHNFIMGLLPWIGKPSFNILTLNCAGSHSLETWSIEWIKQGKPHKPPCLWMVEHDSTK